MFHGLSQVPGHDDAWEYAADIAYSPAAFRSYLARAANVDAFDDRGEFLEYSANGKRWEIKLGPERIEGIALLKMSRMSMRLRLFGYTRAQGDAFLDRFLKHYQRGGG